MIRYRLYRIESCPECGGKGGIDPQGVSIHPRPPSHYALRYHCNTCNGSGTREVRTEVVVGTDLWRYCCERGHHAVSKDPLLTRCSARSQRGTEVYGPECGAAMCYREFSMEVPDDE